VLPRADWRQQQVQNMPAGDEKDDEENMAPERDLKRRKRVTPERGAAAADDPIEGHTWLDNPDNLRKFFDSVARAGERARIREERKKTNR
jgi:hypothetical protein